MNSTIIGKLCHHARNVPSAVAFRYLQDGNSLYQELTYRDLLESAAAVAELLKSVADPGSRIMLFFPPGLAYVKAFYGCLLADMVAVPLYPPRRNTKSDRILNVAQSCESVIALTTDSELANVQASWQEQNNAGIPLSFYATDSLPAVHEVMNCPVADMSATAFLQYTSGSTGAPKGVIITHENIIANLTHLSLMTGASQKDVFVNWVPMFHDLGLVSAILWPVFLAASSVLMAPATFVRTPIIWLEAISRFHGSVGGAPNFAYDLCSQKIPEADLQKLDLSSWRVAYNAAEPVRAETIITFTDRFTVCGFKAETFYPSYGMAETTVFISGGNPTAKPILATVNKKSIAAQKFETVEEDDVMATRMVACGTALTPHDVRVVDPVTCREMSDGNIGEIWFAGPSVSPGYWGLEELSKTTFGQRIADQDYNIYRYLRTGDLGVMWGGEVFITGRMKDLIILRGKNYYPQDIEYSASAAHVALQQGHCAAFSIDEDNVERLVIVAELKREYFRTIDAAEVISLIRQRIMLDHEVNVDCLVLVKPHKIPMTSSGKIQRKKTRQLYLEQQLDVIAQANMECETCYTGPRSETERVLGRIWCSILKRDRVGVFDNFFDIGGNSLNALEITAEVHRRFNLITIDTELILEFPTIAKLAQILDIKMAHVKNVESSQGRQHKVVVI